MKKFVIKIMLLAITIIASNNCIAANDGYEISIKIKGAKDSVGYLVHYYGNKYLVTDTAVNNNYTFTFKGEKDIPGGIYIMVATNDIPPPTPMLSRQSHPTANDDAVRDRKRWGH